MTDVESAANTPRRRWRPKLAAALAVLVLCALGAGAYAVFGAATKSPVSSSCQVVGLSTGNVYRMDPEQLLNASIIADVAMARGLPQRALVVALATAQQESKLRNLNYGDADSLGLFQQRPSQGWGAPAQVMQPQYAAGKFFDALVKVRNWQSLTLSQAADAVQRSAFPDAYRDWEPRATALAAALTGTTSGQLSCRLSKPGAPVVLDSAISALTKDLSADLSITSLAVAQIEADRATVTVSNLLATASDDDSAAMRRDATVAAWAMAHSAVRGITAITIGDREWRADREGWHVAPSPAPAGSVVLTVTVSAR